MYSFKLKFFIIIGHGGSHAAEHLKKHLFENLLKHPSFITDTKSAISMMLVQITLFQDHFVLLVANQQI